MARITKIQLVKEIEILQKRVADALSEIETAKLQAALEWGAKNLEILKRTEDPEERRTWALKYATGYATGKFSMEYPDSMLENSVFYEGFSDGQLARLFPQ